MNLKKLLKKFGRVFIILIQEDNKVLKRTVLIVDNGYSSYEQLCSVVLETQRRMPGSDISVLTFEHRRRFLHENFPEVEVIHPERRIKPKKYQLAIQMFRLRKNNYNFVVLMSLDVTPIAVALLFMKGPLFLYNRWNEWYLLRFRNLWEFVTAKRSADRAKSQQRKNTSIQLLIFIPMLFVCIVVFSYLLIFAIFMVLTNPTPLPVKAWVSINTRPPWIKVTSNSFIKDNKPFKFIGANAVNLVFYDDWDLDIEKAIRTAKENNISVLRCYIDWGWGKDEDIDRILDIASRNGIYIILTLTDCCCSGDYPNLKKYFEVHAPFCNITNSYSINAFKKRIREVIERKNSINGRIYRDDPAIFAWEIANELEFRYFNEADVCRWIEDIADYIKSLDKRHLLTIGINANDSEFDRDSSLYEMFNVPALDFFSFHFYASGDFSNPEKAVALPDEYLGKIGFRTKKFLSMGKPVIMGEFGLNDSIESNFRIRSEGLYIQEFKKCMDAAFSAGASGVMFWGWGIPEEGRIPMWWSQESHSIADEKFCSLLKGYQINRNKTLPGF
jgi:hypothetical protein